MSSLCAWLLGNENEVPSINTDKLSTPVNQEGDANFEL